MIIFYSWQSDTPGKTGHFLIRNALKEAIDGMDIGEAARPELDHDTKGVMGSPAIFETILEKIDVCDVFVADVTIVGHANTQTKKPLINPNVAIELGYALKSKGYEAILLVMNGAHGDGDALPFDLRNRRKPTMFTLDSNADNKACKTAKEKLATTLKPILEKYIKVPRSENKEPFSEAEITVSPAHYFEPDKPIVELDESHGSTKFYCTDKSLLYLRIFPKFKIAPLKAYETRDLMQPGTIQPLSSRNTNGSTARNKYGAIWHSDDLIISAIQLFITREIWSFDASIPSAGISQAGISQYGQKLIPIQKYESVLISNLKSSLKFSQDKLKYTLPVIVEAGLSNAEGYKMYMGTSYIEQYLGPVIDKHIQKRCELSSWDPANINAVLLEIFETFFDACGERRPENFNGFPAKDED